MSAQVLGSVPSTQFPCIGKQSEVIVSVHPFTPSFKTVDANYVVNAIVEAKGRMGK